MNAQVRPPNKYHPNTANDEPSEEHLFVLPKAPLWRRVAALFIDIGITVVLVSAFVDTPQFDPADIESLKTGQTTIYDLIEQMITPGLLTAGLIAQMLLMLRDGFRGGRGIGKGVMGLMVVRKIDLEPCTLLGSITRNYFLLLDDVLGLLIAASSAGEVTSIVLLSEAALMVFDRSGRRIGDRLAETQVVEIDVLRAAQEGFFEDWEEAVD